MNHTMQYDHERITLANLHNKSFIFFACVDGQPWVQTLIQFMHCNFKNKMFAFTNSNIPSPLVVFFNFLQNKHWFTKLRMFYESNVRNKVSFFGTISRFVHL